MKSHVLLNGELRDAETASISVHDGGFLHGAGLFETMRAYGGIPFRYHDHVDRLLASARALDLPFASDEMPSLDDACRLIVENGLSEARVRLTVTTGRLRPEDLGTAPATTVLMTAAPLTAYPPEFYNQGVTVMVSRYRQNPEDALCGHKSTAYFGRLLALRDAQKKSCIEALWFTTDNRLAEGCISNVFLVKGGVVKTPSTDTPILPGVTRALVLELAQRAGQETLETSLTIDDLLNADEVFVTNSAFEVVPVVRVERKAVGSEKPGATTRALLEAYRAEVKS